MAIQDDIRPASRRDSDRSFGLASMRREIAERYAPADAPAIELMRQDGPVCLWRVTTNLGQRNPNRMARTEFHVSNGGVLEFMHMPERTDAEGNHEIARRRSQARRGALAATL